MPFDASQIEWRVTNTTEERTTNRGQVVRMLTEEHTPTSFRERTLDAGRADTQVRHSHQRKFRADPRQEDGSEVLVSCELTILASDHTLRRARSLPDDPNALMAAEDSMVQEGCRCFGAGWPDLYYFDRNLG